MYSFFGSGFRFESSFSCLLGNGESVLGTITGVPVRMLSGLFGSRVHNMFKTE